MKNNEPYILGIGGFLHDGNVAVLDKNGNIMHASQLERFNRKKHSGINSVQEVKDLLYSRIRREVVEKVEWSKKVNFLIFLRKAIANK